jgi:hypothetical protein
MRSNFIICHSKRADWYKYYYKATPYCWRHKTRYSLGYYYTEFICICSKHRAKVFYKKTYHTWREDFHIDQLFEEILI